MRLRPTLLIALAISALGAAALMPAGVATAAPTCAELPDPLRWLTAGPPDRGQATPLIMPHRGANHLGPEETQDAYEVALAYGSDGFEGDVRTTRDGEFVLSHDETTGRLANDGVRDGGPRDLTVAAATVAELKQLNMANHGAFALSAPANPRQTFNPARILTLDEALEIAERHDVGMDLDIKAVSDPIALVNLVARYPRAFRRTFFEADPHEVVLMRTVQPDVNAMYNIGGSEPAGTMYALTQAPWHYRYFGSALSKFTPERVAEMHDGCALAIPHSYDAFEDGKPDEPRSLREGRARGTDGAQVNRVEQATATYGRIPATRIVLRGTRKAPRACLLHATRGLGLPYKTLTAGDEEVVTLRGGCAEFDGRLRRGTVVRFAGDESALASAVTVGAKRRARR